MTMCPQTNLMQELGEIGQRSAEGIICTFLSPPIPIGHCTLVIISFFSTQHYCSSVVYTTSYYYVIFSQEEYII
jgi:hypothetical protein